jgi:cystathionine beta-lyase
MDCRELDLVGTPQAFFLEKAKVGLNDGRDFGEAGEGFVRLNFGCPRALLKQGLSLMGSALSERR